MIINFNFWFNLGTIFFGRIWLQITADCEKTIHKLQCITGDKNKRFSFLSSIIWDFNYDRIHTGQQQKPTGVLLSLGGYWGRKSCTIICSSNLSELNLLKKMKSWKPDYKRIRLLSSRLMQLHDIGAHFEIFLEKAAWKKPFLKRK